MVIARCLQTTWAHWKHRDKVEWMHSEDKVRALGEKKQSGVQLIGDKSKLFFKVILETK